MRRERIISTSPRGLTWLGILEGGFHLTAYHGKHDPPHVWTISAGITFYSPGVRVKKGDKLASMEAAEMLFRERLKEYEATVDAYTRDDITATEFDSLVSFCFNIGAPAFRTSTAVKRFNDRSISLASVGEAMGWFRNAYNPATGKSEYNEGVMERRRCEVYLLRFGLYRVQKEQKPEPPI